MTSRISFYNLCREHIRRRIGVVLLAGFSFFAYLIWFLVSVQNICSNSAWDSYIRKEISALSEPNVYMGRVVTAAAVLLAVSSFRYLHSKKEVDLCHSLPMKRRTQLCVIISGDFLTAAVFLMLTLCLQGVITAAAGYDFPALKIKLAWSYLCCLAVFAAVYLTMALAMVLTGRTFAGLLVFGVLAAYVPLVLYNLFPVLASVFYKTYCADAGWGAVMTYFSPMWPANNLLNDIYNIEGCEIWTWEAHRTEFAVSCIWIAAMGAALSWVFIKRPSETAGRTMTFPGVNGIIRILLVIPASIYTGLFLYTASFSSVRGWIIAGITAGGFLAHGVIESICRLDIRGFIACKKQMLLSVAAAFIIVGFFWADVSGYDAYLPAKEETDAILMDDNFLYSGEFWGKEREGISGAVKDDVLTILADAVAENDRNYELCYAGGELPDTEYSSYEIRYRLKDGREVKRSYVLDPVLNDRLMSRVFDTEEYRKDRFSLYTGDLSQVRDVGFSVLMGDVMIKTVEEQRAEMLRIYLEEFKELDYETAKTTVPWGKFDLSCDMPADERAKYLFQVDCSWYGDTYYIYPSFENTRKYMETWLQEKFPLSFDEIQVTRLDIREDESGAAEEYTIMDEEFIRSVKGHFFGSDVGEGFCPRDPAMNINLTAITEKGTEFVTVYTDPETAEKIRQYHWSDMDRE